jgi:uncharacterized protein
MTRNLALENTFIIPVGREFLVYSPLVNISAFINRSGAMEFQKQMSMAQRDQADPGSKLYILVNEIREGKLHLPNRKTGQLKPEFLGIIPTRSCNGACVYCDFGADKASAERMSFQLASKTIDWYSALMKKQQRETLEIHFFGGEPMMAKDVIEVVVQRAKIAAYENNQRPYFEISTNGQYNKTDAGFLGHYFNKVVLSLDGFKETHNRHRPSGTVKNGFENAIETARIISQSDAELCIRCCVSTLNVNDMEEYTIWLCQNLSLTAINFEILCETDITKESGLFPPDPLDFAIHFQKSREIANGFGVEVAYSSDISELPVVSSCPAGKDTVIVSPDGRISNCYLIREKWRDAGLDLDFGFMGPMGEAQIDMKKVDAIRKVVEDKPRCTGCFCKWSCAGGCHVGITYPGSDVKYADFCLQTRIISAFTLLSDLGFPEKIEELIKSPENLRKLATSKSDNMMEFNV